jgi:hypothetical protein
MTKSPSRPILRSAGVLCSALAIASGPAQADANEVAKKTANAVETGVLKSEDAAKRGGRAAGSGIERGVRWANQGADRLAGKLGLPKGTAADARRAQDTPQRKADVHPDPTLDAPPAAARPAPKTAAASKATP